MAVVVAIQTVGAIHTHAGMFGIKIRMVFNCKRPGQGRKKEIIKLRPESAWWSQLAVQAVPANIYVVRIAYKRRRIVIGFMLSVPPVGKILPVYFFLAIVTIKCLAQVFIQMEIQIKVNIPLGI